MGEGQGEVKSSGEKKPDLQAHNEQRGATHCQLYQLFSECDTHAQQSIKQALAVMDKLLKSLI